MTHHRWVISQNLRHLTPLGLALILIGVLAGCRKGPVTVYVAYDTDNTSGKLIPLHAGETFNLPAGSRGWLLTVTGDISELSAGSSLKAPVTIERALPVLRPSVAETIPAIDGPPVSDRPILLSPVGATTLVNPIYHWTTTPGKTYDIVLRDPVDPLWPARGRQNVVPPVRLSAPASSETETDVRTDRIYEVIVRPAGDSRKADGGQFLVMPNAKDLAPPITHAELFIWSTRALLAKPGRPGDAWLGFNALPASWKEQPVVQSLLRETAMQLHYQEGVREADVALRKLLAP